MKSNYYDLEFYFLFSLLKALAKEGTLISVIPSLVPPAGVGWTPATAPVLRVWGKGLQEPGLRTDDWGVLEDLWARLVKSRAVLFPPSNESDGITKTMEAGSSGTTCSKALRTQG